tara:strand:+ start:71 stop:748 length:678 start_codon:yes stop_codon:yes gene_type:complete
MSFTGTKYDLVATGIEARNSVNQGLYYLNEPRINCTGCYPYPPTVRLQKMGDSVVPTNELVDLESELKGQTVGRAPYILSKNPNAQYMPNGEYNPTQDNNFKTHNLKDCFFPKEYTRLDNPASNIRGMGPNRFQWLCLNPQDKVAFNTGDSRLPFNWNQSSRIIAKDNNRPVLPTPLGQKNVWPKPVDKCLLSPYQSNINLNMCNKNNKIQMNFCGGAHSTTQSM